LARLSKFSRPITPAGFLHIDEDIEHEDDGNEEPLNEEEKEFGALQLVQRYAMFNPHTTFILKPDPSTGKGKLVYKATDPSWKKWKPNNPMSAHWYNADRLRSLIAAYLANERRGGRVLTVREFIENFRGLTGTGKQKKVTEDSDLHGKSLSDMVKDSEIAKHEDLLDAMQKHSKPVPAGLLGTIGKEHIVTRMAADHNVSPESIKYKKIMSQDAAEPHVLEMAFGVFNPEHEAEHGEVICGLNWSPTIGTPIPEFNRILGEMRIDRSDPVCVVMHIARPRFDFTDRGKSTIAI